MFAEQKFNKHCIFCTYSLKGLLLNLTVMKISSNAG